jgi:hypothetical protein
MNNRLLAPRRGGVPPVVSLELSDDGTVVVLAGQSLTFTSIAEGDPEPTALWQESTDGGTTWITVHDGD